MKERRKKLVDSGLVLIILLGLGASFFSYFILLLPQTPFFWDEAFHAEYAFSIHDALSRGDWGRFFEISSWLKLWPFFHSWVAGIVLTVFGPSIAAARLSSLVLLTPSLFLIYFLCRNAFGGRGKPVGVIASFIFALSPLVLYLSAACMLEMLEVFLVCSFFLVYFHAAAGKRRILYVFSGFLLALLYLTKYNYGLLFLLAFALDALIRYLRAAKERKKVLINNSAVVLAGFAVPVGLWLVSGYAGDKLEMLSWYFRGAVGGAGTVIELSAADRALFYLRGLANIYSFSIWIFLFLISGLLLGFFRYRDDKIRMIHLTSLLVIVASSVVRNEQDRYIMPVFPLVAVMGAYSAVWAYHKLKPGWPRRISVFLIVILIVFELPLLPFYCRQVANHTAGLGSFRYPAARGIGCSIFAVPALYPEFLRQPYSCLNPAADFEAAEHDAGDIWDFISRTVGERGSVCCLSVFQEFSHPLWRWYSWTSKIPVFTEWDENCEQARFFAYIDIGPESPYCGREYRRSFRERTRRWIQFLESRGKEGRLKNVASRFWPDISVIVKIFEQPPAAAE